MTETRLCKISDLPEGSSAAFAFDQPDGSRRGVMVIHKYARVHVYENSCPHIGMPLDFTPGKFLDKSGELIICSNHGALFRIDDGHCISGPCAGKTLTGIPYRIFNGYLYITL